MRYLVILIICWLPQFAGAQDWEDHQTFGEPSSRQMLRVLSSTDTSFFAPIIESFLTGNPNVAVEYFVTGTADIDKIFRQHPDRFDLVISSAMDLQLKVANDGFALRLNGIAHPEWAQWGQSLFAFTAEPAVIVVNKEAFAGGSVPKTRQELIEALRDRPEVFQGKVGTYDVRESGFGYLIATQDARSSETFWRLMEVMGRLGTKLYCCSGDMIDDLAAGELMVAYNVLGSYASARHDTHDKLETIQPSDFPMTMMRTALVSKDARHPDIATDFVGHLLALQSQVTEEGTFPLPPLDPQRANGGRSTISLEPALMTYLDDLKRRTFIKEWESAIIQAQ